MGQKTKYTSVGIGFYNGLYTLFAGMFGGLLVGGRTCTQHYILRYLLWRSSYAPWNYAEFLNYYVDNIFLSRIGGGYIFIHHFLMEHFASMTDEDLERLVTSIKRQQ